MQCQWPRWKLRAQSFKRYAKDYPEREGSSQDIEDVEGRPDCDPGHVDSFGLDPTDDVSPLRAMGIDVLMTLVEVFLVSTFEVI